MVHGPDQQAGLRLSGNNGRTAVSAGDEARARVHAKTALEFLGRGAVALMAMFHQHRSDPLLEEFKTDRRIGGGVFAEGCPSNADEQGEARERFHRVSDPKG